MAELVNCVLLEVSINLFLTVDSVVLCLHLGFSALVDRVVSPISKNIFDHVLSLLHQFLDGYLCLSQERLSAVIISTLVSRHLSLSRSRYLVQFYPLV